MGLDMYLYARQFAFNGFKNQDLYNKLVQEAPFALDTATLQVQVAYWRKANQIHKWFVDHVQDGNDNCEEYRVTRDQLQLLLDNCKLVLINKEEAPNLLPPQEGFFFGSYEYDEFYWQDIQDTIEQIEKILNEYPEEWDFQYQSSW
jgi:frataxin-like iron-binding protein CyaY